MSAALGIALLLSPLLVPSLVLASARGRFSGLWPRVWFALRVALISYAAVFGLVLVERAAVQSLLESMRSAKRSWGLIVDFLVIHELRGMVLLLFLLSVGLSYFFLPPATPSIRSFTAPHSGDGAAN